MSNQTDLKVVMRIEKLFAQASDPAATGPERDEFERKAFALLTKYRLTTADLGGNLPADDKLGEHHLDAHIAVGGNGRLFLQVLQSVVEGFDSKMYWHTSYDIPPGFNASRVYSVTVVAWKSDFKLINVLAPRILNSARMSMAATHGDNPWETRNLRRSFLLGYQSQIRSRIAEVFAEEVEALPAPKRSSTELVLVDRKKQVNEAFQKLRLSTAAGVRGEWSSEGVAAGRNAAMAADLSVSGNAVHAPQKTLNR